MPVENLNSPPWRQYLKSVAQPMRPYVPGEDLAGISVSPEDSPAEGGMIACNPKNPADKWYVAEKFFRDNYVQVEDDQ